VEVHIPSEGRELLAWFARPPTAAEASVPVLVYLHGGFALDEEDFGNVSSWLAGGYALLTPTSRGENGNSGDFELMLGEVDDAMAAVHWVANQPRVLRDRIYVFGHSNGGAVAALLSLRGDPLVRVAGSASGLYPASVFRGWDKNGWVPFDASDAAECSARLFLPRIAQVKSRLLAFVSYEEGWTDDMAREKAAPAIKAGAPVSITLVHGDHAGMLEPALLGFREKIAAEP
jgi:dienelactone hydrolase